MDLRKRILITLAKNNNIGLPKNKKQNRQIQTNKERAKSAI